MTHTVLGCRCFSRGAGKSRSNVARGFDREFPVEIPEGHDQGI